MLTSTESDDLLPLIQKRLNDDFEGIISWIRNVIANIYYFNTNRYDTNENVNVVTNKDMMDVNKIICNIFVEELCEDSSHDDEVPSL